MQTEILRIGDMITTWNCYWGYVQATVIAILDDTNEALLMMSGGILSKGDRDFQNWFGAEYEGWHFCKRNR